MLLKTSSEQHCHYSSCCNDDLEKPCAPSFACKLVRQMRLWNRPEVTTFMEDGCVSRLSSFNWVFQRSSREPKENQLRQRWLQENAIRRLTHKTTASLCRWQLSKTTQADSGLQGSARTDLSLCHPYFEEHCPSITEGCPERWSQRTAGFGSDIACNRGTIAHEHCEYALKTAASWSTERNKKVRKVWDDGLARPPKAVTNWAPRKRRRVHRKLHGQPGVRQRFIRLQ